MSAVTFTRLVDTHDRHGRMSTYQASARGDQTVHLLLMAGPITVDLPSMSVAETLEFADALLEAAMAAGATKVDTPVVAQEGEVAS